jgi:hypothetical protein
VNATRSRAYGRVMRMLDGAPPHRFSDDSRQLLREAADTLVLATRNDRSVQLACAVARSVLLTLGHSGLEPWIEQLADDLEDAGPVLR